MMKINKKKYIYGVLLLCLSSCSTINHDESYDIKPLGKDLTEIITNDIKRLNEIRTGIQEKKGDYSKSQYLNQGLTASDSICHLWFKNQITINDDLDHFQSQWNNIGDGTIGLSSLTGGSVKTAGIIAGFLGIGNSWIDNGKQQFRLSDTLYTLYDKLKEVRNEYKITLVSNVSNYSLETVERMLREYHNTCSRITVLEFIKQSVNLVSFDIQKSKKDSALNKIHRLLFKVSGVISEEDLISLYIFEYSKNDSLISKISEISNANKTLYDKYNKAKEKNAAEIRTLLQQLSKYYNLEEALKIAEAKIKTIRKIRTNSNDFSIPKIKTNSNDFVSPKIVLE